MCNRSHRRSITRRSCASSSVATFARQRWAKCGRRPARIFVKPTEHKLFTGFVWIGDSTSRRRVVTHSDETPVWVADVIDIVSEYRSFMLYETMIDCRKYKGDWSKAPDRKIVEAAVKRFKKSAPAAYCLDWGVTADGQTVLVEANDGMSFGPYGLPTVSHARMLAARWFELVS